MPNKIELISLLASVVIVVSMIPKNQLYLRVINAVGSALFIVYGVLLLIESRFSVGYSTTILNCFTLILSIYHSIKIVKTRRRGDDRDNETRTKG